MATLVYTNFSYYSLLFGNVIDPYQLLKNKKIDIGNKITAWIRYNINSENCRERFIIIQLYNGNHVDQKLPLNLENFNLTNDKKDLKIKNFKENLILTTKESPKIQNFEFEERNKKVFFFKF